MNFLRPTKNTEDLRSLLIVDKEQEGFALPARPAGGVAWTQRVHLGSFVKNSTRSRVLDKIVFRGR